MDLLDDFYQSAFGWGMNDAGPDMGNYVVAVTTETDENNMNKTPGTINGGFYKLDGNNSPEPSVVISVENIDESVKMVKDAGGEILGEAQEIPGVGKFVSFKDSEGNRVSMLQASR
jgi:predicted enzyme related to lactoylglutathione lyase